MPPGRRRNLVAARRRRHDEGEEEGSLAGEFEDDSLSEGSAVSNGDDDEADPEGSDISAGEEEEAEEEDHPPPPPRTEDAAQIPSTLHAPADVVGLPGSGTAAKDVFTSTADTEAMLNGIKGAGDAQQGEEIHFDDLTPSTETVAVPQAKVAIPKAPRNETTAQRSRREHQEYITQRNTNPAFVPTRGGFFLHDDRTSNPGFKPAIRGRGRGFNASSSAVRGFNGGPESMEKPWAHDLHERLETTQKLDSTTEAQNSGPARPGEQEKASKPPPPNRTFSFSTVLGNVTVQISLPGMTEKITIPNVVRKQHTLLPQHRPPLRRDKPVRVSIPNEQPRYIFPSTERSFIFIPRALRPNQQAYFRGRGRGSFHGSRRASLLGGSAYTPSVALSRRSSAGGSIAKDGMRSPADSILSRSGAAGPDGSRPIVRLPTAMSTASSTQLPTGPQATNTTPAIHLQAMTGSVVHGSHSTAIPMHQPRPQKAVSVADIESPVSFPFMAPRQQHEQPFHHQVPPHMTGSHTDDGGLKSGLQSHSVVSGGTPLSQIPEGAIYGAGFPAYPVMPPPTYFGSPYTNGPVFYHPSLAEGGAFGLPVAGAAGLPPAFVPGSQSHPLPGSVEAGVQPSTVAHESNGMVYYYNPSLYQNEPHAPVPHFSMGPAMAAPTPFYYPPSVPNGMFYSAPSG